MTELVSHPAGSAIAALLRQMPRWNALLAQRGFGLPAFVQDFVEALRPRPAEELPYDAYLGEVAMEAAHLPRGFWTVEDRAAIPQSARSPYLDMLAARRLAGDEPHPVRDAMARFSLDPNDCLDDLLGYDDSYRKGRHRRQVQACKRGEIPRWEDSIAQLLVNGSDIALPAVKAFLKAACARYGLQYKQWKYDGDNEVYLCRPVAQGLYCGVTWSDFGSLKRWSNLFLGFDFRAADEMGQPLPVPLYARRLDQLVPGGDHYLRGNDDWQAVCLGFLFAINVVDVLAGQCSRVQVPAMYAPVARH